MFSKKVKSNQGKNKSRVMSSPQPSTSRDFIEASSSTAESPLTTRTNNSEPNSEYVLSLATIKPTVIPSSLETLLEEHNPETDYLLNDDELDELQSNLEAMLSSTIQRRNIIKTQNNNFNDIPFKTIEGQSIPVIKQVPVEKKPVINYLYEDAFNPTFKQEVLKESEFWSYAKSYFEPINAEDINWLENKIKSYDSDDQLCEIPPLGEHYSKKKIKEMLDMQEQQSCSHKPSTLLYDKISPDVIESVNRVNLNAHTGNTFVPIHQQVIASLAEHSLISQENIENSEDGEEGDINKSPELSDVCKEFYLEQNNEERLKKLGLVGQFSKSISSTVDTPRSFSKPFEERDEILEELTKCNKMLYQVRKLNKKHFEVLLERCRVAYCRKFIKQKLENVNDQILQFRRRIKPTWTEKQKQIQYNKENDEVKKLLLERSTYLLQMESMNLQPRINLESVNSDYLNYIKNLSSECNITGSKSNGNDISKESNENTSSNEDPGPSKLCVMTPNNKKLNKNFYEKCMNKEEKCSNLRKSVMTRGRGKLPKSPQRKQNILNVKTSKQISVNNSLIIPSVNTIALNRNLRKNNKSSLTVVPQQKCPVEAKCKSNTSINDNFNKKKCGQTLDLSNLYITTAKPDFHNLNTKTSKNIMIKEGEYSNAGKPVKKRRGRGRPSKTSNGEQKTLNLKTTKPIIAKGSSKIVSTVTLNSGLIQNNKLPFDAPLQKCPIEDKNQPNKFINNELNENECSDEELELSNLFITTASSDYNNLNTNFGKNTILEGECSNEGKPVINRGPGRLQKSSNKEQNTFNIETTKSIIAEDSSKMALLDGKLSSEVMRHYTKSPIFYISPRNLPIVDKSQSKPFNDNKFSGNKYNNEELGLSNSFVTPVSFGNDNFNKNISKNSMDREEHISDKKSVLQQDHCRKPLKIPNEKEMISNPKTTKQILMKDFPIHDPVAVVKPNPSIKQTNTSSLLDASLQKLSLEDTQQSMFNTKITKQTVQKKSPLKDSCGNKNYFFSSHQNTSSEDSYGSPDNFICGPEYCFGHLFDQYTEESNLNFTNNSTQVDNKPPPNLKSPYKSSNEESNVSDVFVFDARRKTQ